MVCAGGDSAPGPGGLTHDVLAMQCRRVRVPATGPGARFGAGDDGVSAVGGVLAMG
jgi:hypothetical protein